MEKEKKITINHFVNTAAKPRLVDGKNTYPLYLSITYNRETTKIKMSIYNEFDYNSIAVNAIYLEGSNYEKVENPKSYLGEFPAIFYDKIILEKIIRHEIKTRKSNFSLKGFGDKLKTFYTSMWDVILFPEISYLMKFMPHNEIYIDELNEGKDNREGYSKLYYYYYFYKYFYQDKFFDSIPIKKQDYIIMYIFMGIFRHKFYNEKIIFDRLRTYYFKDSFYVYEWFGTDLKSKFIDYLYSIEDYKNELGLIYNYQTKHLLDDISFDKGLIERYVKSVDSLVNKLGMTSFYFEWFGD